MAEDQVKLLGKKFVEEQLAGLFPRELNAVMRRSTLRIAALIRNDMRRNAPRRQGVLRRAIKSKRARGRRGMVEAEVIITKGSSEKYDAFYWHMVEFGTTHSEEKPFAAPAVARQRATYRSDLAGVIRGQVIKQLEKRAKKQRLKK